MLSVLGVVPWNPVLGLEAMIFYSFPDLKSQ